MTKKSKAFIKAATACVCLACGVTAASYKMLKDFAKARTFQMQFQYSTAEMIAPLAPVKFYEKYWGFNGKPISELLKDTSKDNGALRAALRKELSGIAAAQDGSLFFNGVYDSAQKKICDRIRTIDRYDASNRADAAVVAYYEMAAFCDGNDMGAKGELFAAAANGIGELSEQAWRIIDDEGKTALHADFIERINTHKPKLALESLDWIELARAKNPADTWLLQQFFAGKAKELP